LDELGDDRHVYFHRFMHTLIILKAQGVFT
jgi:hypothetical protein